MRIRNKLVKCIKIDLKKSHYDIVCIKCIKYKYCRISDWYCIHRNEDT